MPTSTDLTNGLERVRYFSRQLITADDMRTEQEYFLQKLRRHNRMLHGAGVVCGLEVSSSPDTGAPLRVAVTGGYALSPQGDEICITKTSYIDLATGGAASGDPCLPATTSSVVTTGGGQRSDVFVGVRYDECPSRPVRVTPPGCGCGDSTCDYSRTRDGWKLGCWPVPSNWTAPAKPTTCADAISALLTCPPGSSDVWVILARVTFDATDSSKLGSIDNTVRQWLLSTAVLQGVCCAASSGGATPTPPEGTGKVQSVAVTPSTKPKQCRGRRQMPPWER